MKQIHKSAIVPYSPEQMYVMVAAVDTYPEFLPWCNDAAIVKQEGDKVIASISMGKMGLNKSFTTENILTPHESIEMHLLNGPFQHLYGYWHFQALGTDGCKVTLDMEFEIQNALLRVSLEPVFTTIVNTLIDAFIQRAQQCYD